MRLEHHSRLFVVFFCVLLSKTPIRLKKLGKPTFRAIFLLNKNPRDMVDDKNGVILHNL